MKNLLNRLIQMMCVVTVTGIVAVGCSSPATIRGQDISASGPTVLNARTQPTTIELNRNLNPTTQSSEVLADVKDFTGNVNQVTLTFNHVPLQIPMQNIGGSTWRAQLSASQLRQLAVSGKTATYDATVVAKNDQGQIGESKSPVIITIKTPDLSQEATG